MFVFRHVLFINYKIIHTSLRPPTKSLPLQQNFNRTKIPYLYKNSILLNTHQKKNTRPNSNDHSLKSPNHNARRNKAAISKRPSLSLRQSSPQLTHPPELTKMRVPPGPGAKSRLAGVTDRRPLRPISDIWEPRRVRNESVAVVRATSVARAAGRRAL